ncbi:four-carbon acid sugar kinase family protein [Dysosmobacter sp.]|uniref:four-carbon acid sugar kinase family protein n=1 Tax=Dysosmobacter sp. TaxID=2591382 RepID=UPI002A96C046|nr:four-carbon acid sugar kinase family protein [Dysosmobacter sp.]MCI6053754.1 hydroxyacid dehydrogenase [Dysosmobacter sp.]MDY5509591.1 four-carbon acid sugar kinase family protein [Dysosmobacter sp.]
MNHYYHSLSELFTQYPPLPEEPVRQSLFQALGAFDQTIVVLDDDPTGTQTVRAVPVVTEWSRDTLRNELARKPRMLFVLTNSRSLSAEETEQLHRELAQNIAWASETVGREVLLVSRGDSTLRGHFPLETETLREGLEKALGITFDGEILCPFFPEGGRYTVGDIHYLEEDGCLVPVGQSEFAKDKTFGYQNSHLGQWVEEKTGGRWRAEDVISISLEDLRREDADTVLKKLSAARDFQKIVVNAVCYRDLEVFVPLLLKSIREGKRFVLRTAAAILRVMCGCLDDTVLERETLIKGQNRNGGIVIVGSHVSKTTRQLKALCQEFPMEKLEFNQHLVLDESRFQEEILRVSNLADEAVCHGRDVVVYTRRERLDLNGTDKEEELRLAVQISQGLVQVISNLQIRPRFVIAKGGITSSDVATKGLSISRAEVMGQILPGIPVWQSGPESKFPHMPYVIFPGNVGNDDSLLKAVRKLSPLVDTTEG